jgi:hypothetical protein
MIEQKGNDPSHEPDLTRERRWDVDRIAPWSPAIVARKIAVLKPDEQLTEYPPTYEFENWADFEANAGSVGIDVDDYRERLA